MSLQQHRFSRDSVSATPLHFALCVRARTTDNSPLRFRRLCDGAIIFAHFRLFFELYAFYFFRHSDMYQSGGNDGSSSPRRSSVHARRSFVLVPSGSYVWNESFSPLLRTAGAPCLESCLPRRWRKPSDQTFPQFRRMTFPTLAFLPSPFNGWPPSSVGGSDLALISGTPRSDRFANSRSMFSHPV